MKTSYKLLEKYSSITFNAQELAKKLTMAGLEVEEIRDYAKPLQNVVTGKVIEKKPHPNADKLSICKVDIKSTLLPIVCGANNFNMGDVVCVALIDAMLPNGLVIKESTIRGELSQGMLCSTKELGLYDSTGIWILPKGSPIGESINSFLPEKDTLYTFSLTPNRGDALSTLGIAREVNLLEKKTSLHINIPNIEVQKSLQSPTISLNTPLCPRYMARIIKGITVKESPEWLKIALYKYGLNSVNNIVDAGNFVMMELGQPTHAFDLNKLKSSHVTVENLEKDIEMVGLNKETYNLPKNALVVKDEEKIVALAGIMGAFNSCIDANTTEILLEAAYFDPISVRITSQTLNLATDSSYRFVRDIDVENIPNALNVLTDLILNIAGGKASEITDAYPAPKKNTEIKVSSDFIGQKLGFNLEKKELESIFTLLGFHFTEKEKDYLITIPSYRNDCSIPEDIVEEVIRVYGYENLPLSLPSMALSIENFSRTLDFTQSTKEFLAQNGFNEIINFSFIKEEREKELSLLPFIKGSSILVQNPLNSDFTTLRSSLIGASFDFILKSFTQGTKDLHAFEVGNVHYKTLKGEYKEETHLLCFLSGQETPDSYNKKGEQSTFFSLKKIAQSLFHLIGLTPFIEYKQEKEIPFLHPEKSASINYKGEFIGFIGELHPRFYSIYKIKTPLFIMEYNITGFNNTLLEQNARSFTPISKYPSLTRDLAFVLESHIPSFDLIKEITTVSPIIKNTFIKDVYENEKLGEGKKSLTISIVLQSNEKTLTEEEINEILKNIVSLIANKWNAKLREE